MLTLKTAIGIEIQGADLELVCLKRGLRGLLVAERVRWQSYRTLSPAEAGRRYREFLKGQGLKAANAVVSLPRREALLRLLALPVEAERNLAKAVEYQLDSLHPFEEGGVYYDFAVLRRAGVAGAPNAPRIWARWGGSGAASDAGRLQVAVVMVEKKAADAHYEWFSQAGISVAGFTVSAAAIYGALSAQPGPAIVVNVRDGSIELLGFSSQALFSKEVGALEADATEVLERELALCRAEMRLGPEARPLLALTGEKLELPGAPAGYEPASIERLVRPPAVAHGAAFQLGEHFGAYAAALAALDGAGRAFRVNLLPVEKRVYRSPWTYAPTYVLAALVAALGFALGVRGSVQDRFYLDRLNAEIRALQPKVTYAEKLDSHQRQALDRLVLLQSLKLETGVKLQALAELTRVLPPTVWLQEAEFRDDAITVAGQADSAATLLRTLDDSPFFRNAEFLSSITKTGDGKEIFRIRLRLKTLLPPPSGAMPGAKP